MTISILLTLIIYVVALAVLFIQPLYVRLPDRSREYFSR